MKKLLITLLVFGSNSLFAYQKPVSYGELVGKYELVSCEDGHGMNITDTFSFLEIEITNPSMDKVEISFKKTNESELQKWTFENINKSKIKIPSYVSNCIDSTVESFTDNGELVREYKTARFCTIPLFNIVRTLKLSAIDGQKIRLSFLSNEYRRESAGARGYVCYFSKTSL